MFASVPSPSSAVLEIGPLSLHAYGVCIALGAFAAVWLAGRRWANAGGRKDDITTIAMWSIPAGILGARLYHVITDNHLYREEPIRALYIWDGGLGIWGGIAAGVLTGLFVGRRLGLASLALLDAAAPALALAQAIGRLGNYFNQELFGRPTSVPWALEISPENRPVGLEFQPTFHPTFAYESLWNLALCGVLLLVDRRFDLKPGRLFLLYVAGYTAARFFIEGLRVDEATMVAGFRINELVSAGIFLTTIVLAVILRPHRLSTESQKA